MCATCGCGEGEGATLLDPASGTQESIPRLESDHVHDRDAGTLHPHTHDHPHDHDHDTDQPHVHGPAASTRPSRTLVLEERVLAANDRLASENRGWFAGRGVTALNMIGSPGSGKTTLLEATLARLKDRVSIGVVEGDLATARDAQRILAAGGRAVQVTTGTVCHLDARMVSRAVERLNPQGGSIVVIENVGNLVCPALFDLGETVRVVLLSVTEGDDKPLKYPHVFRSSDVLVLTKSDLEPHVPFDRQRCIAAARVANPAIEVIRVSALKGDGMDDWCRWIEGLTRRIADRDARRDP